MIPNYEVGDIVEYTHTKERIVCRIDCIYYEEGTPFKYLLSNGVDKGPYQLRICRRKRAASVNEIQNKILEISKEDKFEQMSLRTIGKKVGRAHPQSVIYHILTLIKDLQ